MSGNEERRWKAMEGDERRWDMKDDDEGVLRVFGVLVLAYLLVAGVMVVQ